MRLDPRVKERLKKTFTEELSSQKEEVTVYSGYQLSEEELNTIVARFPQFKGSSIQNKVDSTLIGGFIIQSGSKLIDLSIRNALHLLKKQLYESN
jgi:ATP synthase F1 delta subunit